MDVGLDKGYIIAQEVVDDIGNQTLHSSYMNLDTAAKGMFRKTFRYYWHWPGMEKICRREGTYHSLKDGEAIKSVIDTYDYP